MSGTAVILQGGGLRGAYSVGVLSALYDAGWQESVDAIYAVSSGVFAASYFVAGQVQDMEDTWRNRVHGNQLIDYRNLMSSKPVLKLDYLISLFQHEVWLDVERIRRSRTKLTYVATHSKTGQAHYLDAKEDDIFNRMRASSAVPRLYTIPVHVGGQLCHDGGQSDPIPVRRAIADGFDRIIVVLTRPPRFLGSKASWLRNKVILGSSAEDRRQWRSIHTMYNDAIDLIHRPAPNTEIHIIAPEKKTMAPLCRNRERIIATIEAGKSGARRQFLER